MVIDGRYLIKFTDFVTKYPEMAKLSKALLGMLCNETKVFKKRIKNRDEILNIYLQPSTLEQLQKAMTFTRAYNRANGKTYDELKKVYDKKMLSKRLIGRLCSNNILLSEHIENRVYLIDETQFAHFMQIFL